MSKYILVVDDNPSDLLLASFHIEKIGYMPIAARDGFFAIDMLDSHDYKVILVDLQMPKMSGIDLIKRIRRIDKFKNTPIVVMSARQETRDVKLAIGVGASDYIVKPIDGQIFEEKIFKYLGTDDQWTEYVIPTEKNEDKKGYDKQNIELKSISEVGATLITEKCWIEGETHEVGFNILSSSGVSCLLTKVISSKPLDGKFISKVSFVGITEEIRKKIRLICRELWKQHQNLQG